MSVNIATEVRRISDARSRLKSIIDLQAQNMAKSISPDNLKFQTNATMVQSDKLVTDSLALERQYGKAKTSMVVPQAPIEPDMTNLTLWMPFDNLGKQPDLAYMGNTGKTRGCCWLEPGPPNNGNDLIGGSRAIRFDGYTSYVDVEDSPGLRMPTTGGFSFCFRMFSRGFVPQRDNWWRRTIATKMDDQLHGWMVLQNESNGDLCFHIRNGQSTYYRVKFTNMQLNTWYDIVVTYALTGNVLTIYRNGVASTTADTTGQQLGYMAYDYKLHVGRANDQWIGGEANEYGIGGGFDAQSFDSVSFGTTPYQDPPWNTIPWSTIDGAFMGLLYDIRYYRIVLSQPQVTNLYQNKFSISSIVPGQCANAGYCLSKS